MEGTVNHGARMHNKHDALSCIAGDQTPFADEETRVDLEHAAITTRQ